MVSKLIKINFLLFITMITIPKAYCGSKACVSLFEKKPINAAIEADLIRLKQQFETDYIQSVASNWRFNMPEEVSFLLKDPVEGSAKIEALKILGFKITDNEIHSPSYLEVIHNYIHALLARGLKLEDMILPALVLWRYDNNYQYQYYLMTPGVDPWPTTPGYQALSSPVFNLPYNVILKAQQRGRFPLMDGAHDLFHFVSFLNHPEYMTTLLHNVRKITEPRPVKKMGFRLNYIFE